VRLLSLGSNILDNLRRKLSGALQWDIVDGIGHEHNGNIGITILKDEMVLIGGAEEAQNLLRLTPQKVYRATLWKRPE
jgi:hypothetical protein